jgi:hypothetical protein
MRVVTSAATLQFAVQEQQGIKPQTLAQTS